MALSVQLAVAELQGQSSSGIIRNGHSVLKSLCPAGQRPGCLRGVHFGLSNKCAVTWFPWSLLLPPGRLWSRVCLGLLLLLSGGLVALLLGFTSSLVFPMRVLSLPKHHLGLVLGALDSDFPGCPMTSFTACAFDLFPDTVPHPESSGLSSGSASRNSAGLLVTCRSGSLEFISGQVQGLRPGDGSDGPACGFPIVPV